MLIVIVVLGFTFSQCPFSVLVTSGHFDLMYPFDDLALHLTYAVDFPTPAPSSSFMEMNPLMESPPCTVLLVVETSSSSTGTNVVLEM